VKILTRLIVSFFDFDALLSALEVGARYLAFLHDGSTWTHSLPLLRRDEWNVVGIRQVMGLPKGRERNGQPAALTTTST
jgi:hypothetical protein